MRIAILGEGKLGVALTSRLINEKHDVVVIDTNQDVLSKHEDALDALFIKGSGVSVETLAEADIRRADVVIATTVSDETNMLACLTAKKLGAAYTIARIRDPQYLSSLPFLQKELEIDYIVNPERATARAISRMLRFPYAGNIETFGHGLVEMLDFEASEGDVCVGVPLKDMYKVNKGMPQVLFCAVERGESDFIPRGDFVIQPGDRVHVMGEVMALTNFFKYIGKESGKMRSVMVMGGSRIAYYLARMLLEMNIAVTILEMDEDRARDLSEMLPKATIINGDGTDQDLLLSEGLTEYDAFVTLSGRDEDNLMSGLYAAQQGVKKVIVKNDRDNYASLIAKFGLSSIVSPLTITCNTILRTVRGRSGRKADSVQRMYKLMDGKYEALEFIADRKDDFIGVPLKDLTISPDCLVGVIVRDNQVLIPFGNDTIGAGDSVVVISKSEGLYALSQVLTKRG